MAFIRHIESTISERKVKTLQNHSKGSGISVQGVWHLVSRFYRPYRENFVRRLLLQNFGQASLVIISYIKLICLI